MDETNFVDGFEAMQELLGKSLKVCLKQVKDATALLHVVSSVATVEKLGDLENISILSDILEESCDSEWFQILQTGAQSTLWNILVVLVRFLICAEYFNHDLLLCHLMAAMNYLGVTRSIQ